MNAAVTSAVTSANTYTDTEIGKIQSGVASDLAGYVKTGDFNTFKTANTSAIGAAKLEAVGTAANDATTKAGKALTDAKAYTDTKVGNLGTSSDVVSYVDAKTSGIAKEADLTTLQNTVDGHTTSITNLTNNKLDKSTYNTDKATFETINGAAGKYEPILDAAERAAITSGITAAKVADIATAKQVAENQLADARDGLYVQHKQLRYNLSSAYEDFDTQKMNIDVSQRVFNSVVNKFEYGYASSMELTNASTTFLTAQSDYIKSILNLVEAQINLKKLLNK
jgi:hypothetical protein